MSEIKKEMSLSVVRHPDFGEIRTEKINGEPWFCANDVCQALGLKSNPRTIIKHHCFEEDVNKIYVGVVTGNKQDGSPAIQNVKMNFINESGMYALIFNSEKEAAKKFKHWVTSEVLPELRKKGYYGVAPVSTDTAADLQRRVQEVQDFQNELRWHLTPSDKYAIAKKHGMYEDRVDTILMGYEKNITVLLDCIDRSLKNANAKRLLADSSFRQQILAALRGEVSINSVQLKIK